MTATLVVVDGPNLYNDLARYMEEASPGAAPRPGVESYYRHWFDIDRLVRATLESYIPLDTWAGLGTVVFHSRKALGDGPARLTGEETANFWARQGSNENTSIVLVDIHGAKEKGLDTSIVVYLFETHERWDIAVLVASDADYVPVVHSLRRKGKRVYCSSPTSDRARPLVQACQHFVPWDLAFVEGDRAFFEALQPDGALDRVVRYPSIASGSPRIECERDGLVISGSNRRYSEEDVQCAVGAFGDPGSALAVTTTGLVGALRISCASRTDLVVQGLLRHVELFAGATWSNALVWR